MTSVGTRTCLLQVSLQLCHGENLLSLSYYYYYDNENLHLIFQNIYFIAADVIL